MNAAFGCDPNVGALKAYGLDELVFHGHEVKAFGDRRYNKSGCIIPSEYHASGHMAYITCVFDTSRTFWFCSKLSRQTPRIRRFVLQYL